MALLIRLLSLCLAGVLLYLALAGLDWSAFVTALISMHPAWIGVCLGLEMIALIVRAYRWSLLLSSRAGSCLFISFIGETIGDLGNTFFPARAGEAMRTLLVSRRLDLDLPFVIGTATTERVSDAVFLALTAFAMMLLVPQTPTWLTGAALLFFALGIAMLAILSFLPAFNTRILPLLHGTSRRSRFTDKLEEILTGIWLGTQALFGHPRRILLYLLLTVAVWVGDAGAILCLAGALGDPLHFAEAMLFLAALGLSSAIPSTPGYLGIYQFVAVSVLVPFGLSRVHAIAIILVFQITVILQELLWGGLGWAAMVNNWIPYSRHRRPA